MPQQIESLNAFELALQNFDAAADLLQLDATVRDRIRLPERDLIVHFPVEMRTGRIKMFTGYRIQHSTAAGPPRAASVTTRISRSTK